MEDDARVLDEVMGKTPDEKAGDLPTFLPATDIFESENEIVILADMPGVSPENATVGIEDDVLTMRGRIVPEAGDERELVREYGTGDYFRQFTLGKTVDQAGIRAALKNGVLRITLPKAPPREPCKVEVKAG